MMPDLDKAFATLVSREDITMFSLIRLKNKWQVSRRMHPSGAWQIEFFEDPLEGFIKMATKRRRDTSDLV